jgi:signal transduction histidine kinase
LKLVKDELRRLDHILEDFLQFARPRELEARDVELSSLLAAVLDLMKGEFERREVRLERRLGAPALVRGDEERLRQILMNLFLNALEAVGPGGQVWVTCAVLAHDDPEGAARFAEIGVDDDGPGFAPGVRDRIFEPFFTTKAKGSGLGLSIAHAIALQHGGTIEAEPSPLGGARMVLRLPSSSA